MTNLALYKLLVRFGATEDEAETAATVDMSALITKADLAATKAELLSTIDKLEVSLIRWGVALLFTALGIQAALIIFAVSRMMPGR